MYRTFIDAYRKQAVSNTIKYLKVHNHYKLVKKIGGGTYGDVVELLSPDKHRRVAAKIILENLVSEAEKETWPHLAHENLLPLITAAHVPSTHCYVFLSPRCSSDLKSLSEGSALRKDKGGFSKALSWIQGVCSGMKYLHEKQLCHLDIKLSNILISEKGIAQLCDFGSLTHTEGPTNRYVSPVMYRPPEAIISEGGRQAVVNGFQYDVYTIGMMCLELLTKEAFGQSQSWEQEFPKWTTDIYPKIFDILQKESFENLVKKAFRKSKVKRKMLCDLRDFLRGCLNLNPKKRPTVDDLLRHRIFGGEKVFREMKYGVWLERWDVKKMQFLVDLYVGKAVMLEFQSTSRQTDICTSEDKLKNVDVKTKNEDIITGSKVGEQANIEERETIDEEKKKIADIEIDEKETENISTSCDSCLSDETEFVEIKTKKSVFYDWIGRKKSGFAKAFNRLCCCCCRKKDPE